METKKRTFLDYKVENLKSFEKSKIEAVEFDYWSGKYRHHNPFYLDCFEGYMALMLDTWLMVGYYGRVAKRPLNRYRKNFVIDRMFGSTPFHRMIAEAEGKLFRKPSEK